MSYWRKSTKYGNRKTKVDGITFDSAKEAKRWKELVLLEEAGEIYKLRRQEKFVLVPSQRINGKVVERAVTYIADFTYEKDGKFVVKDTKGVLTEVYKIKRKLMLSVYGIQIKEI